MSDKILGTRQAGVIAGKNQRTIVAWIHAGKLRAMKLPGQRGPYLINKADLEEAIRELTTPKPYVPEEKDGQS